MDYWILIDKNEYKIGSHDSIEPMYFVLTHQIPYWAFKNLKYVQKVKIPKNIKIKTEKNRFYSYKLFIISSKISISDLQIWKNNKFIQYAVEIDSCNIQYIANPSNEICKYVVSKDGFNLRFLKDEPEELCIIAVKQVPIILKMLKKQNYNICLEAVKTNGMALEFVDDEYKTTEIYKLAIMNNGISIRFVSNQTLELCQLAYSNNKSALEYMEKRFAEKIAK